MVPEIPAPRAGFENPSADWARLVERDGYAIVPDVVEPAVVAALIEALDALGPEAQALRRGGSLYGMRNLLGALPAARSLARSAALHSLARRVLGPTAFVVRGLLFDKTPEANWLVPWHRDLTIAVKSRTDAPGYGPWTVKGGIPHVRPPLSVLERMVTLRVHLDDSDERSGPLRVLPGSHVGDRAGVDSTRDGPGRAEPRACMVARGGVLLMRPLLLHASSPADAPGRRRVVHLEYAAGPLPGGVEWFRIGDPRPMKFTKMHGLGNDYVYVSTFDQEAPADPSRLARAVSDRHFGIGGDGLILIMPSDRADARMRMFNADGSEAEMCGNGVRCVAKYIHDHGLAPAGRVTVETGRGILTLDLETAGGKARRVRVDMGVPILQGSDIPTRLPGDPPVDVPLTVAGHDLAVTAVSTGNPHAVAYVDDVAAFPVETVGPALEQHASFPRRVNVHFVEVLGPGEVKMRTWERGSGITLACGTGACAVCVAGVLTGRTGRTIVAHLPGGDLELEWPGNDRSVFMTGPATEVFSGVWNG